MQQSGGETGRTRLEWRGDFFASERGLILDRLSLYPEIARPFRHTLTLFLAKTPHPEPALEPVVRLRAYANLSELSASSIQAWLHAQPSGKLQVKYTGGAEEHGEVTLQPGPGGLPVCTLHGEDYVPASLRVAARRHFAMTEAGLPAPRDVSEHHRITLDAERHLFRVHRDGSVAALGEMGPRLEIKTPSPEAAATALAAVNGSDEAKVVPWRGLELLFQAMLRDRIARDSIVPGRELELKFEVHGEVAAEAVLESLRDHGEWLLPFPHRIERLRRYHICRHLTDAASEYTIVETPAGKLSQKRKRERALHGAVVARRTEAMFTTDRDGRACPVEEFCADNALVALNSFAKSQTKVPFLLANGHAYQVSLDRCHDRAGRALSQLEIEYIGNASGGPSPTAEIAAELEGLGDLLRASPLGGRLTPSMRSKHAFFRVQVESHEAIAADMNA